MPLQVIAQRWERGWTLTVGGIGTTQCRRLSQADSAVREYVASVAPDHRPYEDEIDMDIRLGGELDTELAAMKVAKLKAHMAQTTATGRMRAVAHELHRAGLAGAEIAIVLGVSAQRVSALLSLRRDQPRKQVTA